MGDGWVLCQFLCGRRSALTLPVEWQSVITLRCYGCRRGIAAQIRAAHLGQPKAVR